MQPARFCMCTPVMLANFEKLDKHWNDELTVPSLALSGRLIVGEGAAGCDLLGAQISGAVSKVSDQLHLIGPDCSAVIVLP